MKTGRRAFVKGSMAAPLVLTVGPAAARAQASHMVCIGRDAARAAGARPAALTPADYDDWLRVAVDIVELREWSDGALKVVPGEFFLGADKSTYWQIGQAGFTPTATPTKYNRSNCVERRLGKRRFALVYVNDQGRQTGFAWEKNGGHPLTGSCWVSIAPFRA